MNKIADRRCILQINKLVYLIHVRHLENNNNKIYTRLAYSIAGSRLCACMQFTVSIVHIRWVCCFFFFSFAFSVSSVGRSSPSSLLVQCLLDGKLEIVRFTFICCWCLSHDISISLLLSTRSIHFVIPNMRSNCNSRCHTELTEPIHASHTSKHNAPLCQAREYLSSA